MMSVFFFSGNFRAYNNYCCIWLCAQFRALSPTSLPGSLSPGNKVALRFKGELKTVTQSLANTKEQMKVLSKTDAKK